MASLSMARSQRQNLEYFIPYARCEFLEINLSIIYNNNQGKLFICACTIFKRLLLMASIIYGHHCLIQSIVREFGNFKQVFVNRIIQIVQKMMRKEEGCNKNSEVASICSELNLNTDKLNIEQLMNNPTYRRLYNIVINDMSRSELSFRKNLIKELYFLLQIAPIIKPQLKQHFLSEVEKWYNLNDHKKIDLASNKLNRLLHIVHHSKKQSTHEANVERPKTGIAWNQNVSPFLRPYTAKRSTSNLKGKKMRPQSSKFGAESTKVDTNDDIFIREFTTNIQEQLQISQDFLQKHRTNHPEYEPTYQQLYRILKKVQTHSNTDKEEPLLQLPITKCTRYSKSAIPRKKQVLFEKPQSNKHLTDHSQEIIGLEERAKDSDQSSDEQEEILYMSQSKKEQSNKIGKPQVKTEETVLEKQFDNLYKYTNQIENKLVQALREDREMARKYVDFARTKTAMKKQLNRKNQSKRLLSAKLSTARSYKMIRNNTIDNKENQVQTCAVYDLTNDPLNIANVPPNAHPTYNRREFLKKRYEEPVRAFKKINHIQQVPEKIKSNVKRPMTAFVRFHSPVRFDPMSDENVKKYNQQVLQEIQKIKIKMGGKCSASTDSLMKALYVDTISNDQFKWQDQNPFYGMISKGKQKKLKKKGRKLKSKPKLVGK